jgi:hypothetical protein
MTEQSDARSKVIAFVKFCREESHADQFIKGSLYMNRLRYFQKLEASDKDDGRSDPYEAISSWHQPDRIEVVISFRGFNSIKIAKNEMASPLVISRNHYSDMHLFCIYALSLPYPAFLQGDHDEIQAKLQAAASQIDSRCLDFGPYAVIVWPDQFCEKLSQALQQCNYWRKVGMVEYYDEKAFHGDFAQEDVPFRKQSRFAYQKEFRVCLQTPAGDEPLTFEIGDMSAFATKVRSADINASFKVTLTNNDSQ